MTSQSETQLNESRNAIAVTAAFMRGDVADAELILNTCVKDHAAYVVAMQAVACTLARAIDGMTTLTGITSAQILDQLAMQHAIAGDTE